MAYNHALRASELVGFTKDDIKDGYLTIVREKGSLRTTQPLIEHKEPLLNEREPLIRYARNSSSGFVFNFHRMTFWRMMQEHCRTAGIPSHKAHPHILKHSICFHLIEKQVPIEVVREWAGHKSLSSTGFYLRMSADKVFNSVKNAMVKS